MNSFTRLVTAGPLFFVSAWLLMIFAGIVASDVGIRPFGYITSMVATIGLWLVMAPAIGAVAHGNSPRNPARSRNRRAWRPPVPARRWAGTGGPLRVAGGGPGPGGEGNAAQDLAEAGRPDGAERLSRGGRRGPQAIRDGDQLVRIGTLVTAAADR